MALVKASEANFHFPVFAFIKDGDYGGYPDQTSLRDYREWHFRDNIYPDMELIDAGGRCWIVRRAYLIPLPRLLKWWHVGPLKPPIQSELELEIEQRDSVEFPALVDRICSHLIESRQKGLSSGEQVSSEACLQEELARLRATKDADDLFDAEVLWAQPGFTD